MSSLSSSNLAALGISFVTSSVIFARRVLVLHKTIWPPTLSLLASWVTSLYAGILFWLSLNALDQHIGYQLLAGVTSTTLAWLVYVLLVNESLALPTRSQWLSLSFYILTEALILLEVRLVLR